MTLFKETMRKFKKNIHEDDQEDDSTLTIEEPTDLIKDRYSGSIATYIQ